MTEDIRWCKWTAGKWLVGTQELDRLTEYIFFRLVNYAYEQNDATLRGTNRRNAMRCKSTIEEYSQALEVLQEVEKIEIVDDGVFIPSVERRLSEARAAMKGRQIGAAKARRRNELRKEGLKTTEIDLMIKREFPDDQDVNQSDDQPSKKEKKEKKREEEIDKRGCGGDFQLEVEEHDFELEAMELYNLTADRLGLSKAQTLTPSRRKKLKNRLSECGGIEGWKLALSKIDESNFLQGKGKADWKANFDWMIQQSSFTRLVEGNYSNASQNQNTLSEIDKI